MSTMEENVLKSTEKKRHYCCVCSNYRGKLVEGRSVTLHRFPTDDKLRKLWISRIKTVSQIFNCNLKNDRLCSEHFLDGTYTKENSIPCRFVVDNKVKVFKLAQNADCLRLPSPSEEAVPADLFEEEVYHNLSLRSRDVAECVSARLHDYCGDGHFTVETERLPKEVQTDCRITCDVSTQTEVEVPKQTSEQGTQTPVMEQTEVGCQVGLPDLTIEDINSSEMCMFYTGIPTTSEFHLLFNELSDAEENTHRSGDGLKKGRPRSLRLIDEFFLVLMRLRLGLLLEDLAHRFKVSKATCSLIVNEWLGYLAVKLSSLTPWPSKVSIQQTMPRKFKKRYPKCRVIIDCTEFYTQNPQSLSNKSLMYSHYKSHMTWKALLGISPAGIITFVSEMWTGSISDKQLTLKSGILDMCEPGDAIMADKGFQIGDLTAPRGLHLIIPPMKFEKFNKRQVEETRRIANLRIDVERAVERVKNFRILQGVMPINMSHQGTDILKICVGLSNLLPPLVHDCDD